MVTIISGANELKADAAGKTIAQVQSTYAGALNIPTNARAQINGRPASPTDQVKDNDRVVFAAATAEKGL